MSHISRRNYNNSINGGQYGGRHGLAPMDGTYSNTEILPGPAPCTAGPHRHDILNKLDPTVDSKSGGAQILGSTAPATRNQGMRTEYNDQDVRADCHQGMGADYGRGTGADYGPQHSTRLGNALDPRVDSSTMCGAVPQTTTTTNVPGGAMHGHGPLDPVHGGITRRAGHHGGNAIYPENTTATGPARNTAGPHRSDLLNKLDPTVDSKPTQTSMRQHRVV